MTDHYELAKSVEDLLNALGVTRVVYVDDAIDSSVPLASVIAAAGGIDPAVLLSILPELGDSVPEDLDVLSTRIKAIWPLLDTEVQNERGQTIVEAMKGEDESGTDDRANIAIIANLIPDDKFIGLSPTEWDTQKDTLLHDAEEKPTLFLFDQDLSDAGGASDGGIKIIASLLASPGTESRICGLVTHTVTPENQPERWDALSKEHGIPKDRFVVIPKLHLSQSPMLFAQSLKFAALSPAFDELKRKAQEILTQATADAAKRIEQVNIYDLDHIVFQVPNKEGLWEPDMLFRLHAMFHRTESRRLAHEGNLESIAAKLRVVSSIPTPSNPMLPPQSTWDLQREELYETGDHINKNHLPLELGDIFERVGADSNKKYILLAQPCDLMVRSGGKRAPELNRIPLAEVVMSEKAKNYSQELPYFDKAASNRWFVRLKAISFVSATVLDLCVFNQDGVARLAIDGTAPDGIRPTWKSRHKIMSKYWKSALRKTEILVPASSDTGGMKQLKEQICRNIGGALYKDELFKGSTIINGSARSIEFNCRRIERLSRERAFGLLMSYTATLGRPAYDRTFVDDQECAK